MFLRDTESSRKGKKMMHVMMQEVFNQKHKEQMHTHANLGVLRSKMKYATDSRKTEYK